MILALMHFTEIKNSMWLITADNALGFHDIFVLLSQICSWIQGVLPVITICFDLFPSLLMLILCALSPLSGGIRCSFLLLVFIFFASLKVFLWRVIRLNIDDILFMLLNEWRRLWRSICLFLLRIWFAFALLPSFVLLLIAHLLHPGLPELLFSLCLFKPFRIISQLLFFLESLVFLLQLCLCEFLHLLLLLLLFYLFGCLLELLLPLFF